MSQSLENMILAAQPSSAAALVAAGGVLPALGSLVDTAQAALMKETLEGLVSDSVNILQGVNSLMSNIQVDIAATKKALAKLEADAAYAERTVTYFRATNNIFPARKLAGIPTPASAKARFPDIDKIPEDWTPPAEAPAARTGTSS